ncbi:carbohydrate ABC transporter permease [Luteimicrobium subarcticum]|uniref:N,N'-diacetylchitobiose transport system permease protein n=1 Tax=Luteimicrobium subarcticum TaxID=620910 RepID=A0A2M8WUB2_9MICO|nr:carbohydrate ABC transporter permease [Luteimicrobium subarcticum]PJI94535.1 N,N'-diacetylchitobiose transport system permease protein [Luteimicrobium subarcticum]
MTATSTAAPLGAVDSAERPPVAPRRRRRRHNTGTNIIAGIVSLIWVFPVYWMLNTSFKPLGDVSNLTPQFLPKHPTFQNYVTAVTKTDFLINLRNSVIVVLGTLILAIGLAFFASAALSRFRFKSRRPILVAILAVQMLPAAALLIPQFLVFNRLGLLGSYLGLILAYVAATLPFSIWVMRGFFVAIPKEMEEAAQVDGAKTWTILWKIWFPLVAPGVISTSIFAFIAAWNDYLTAYVFMKDQSMYTLPLWLASFSVPNQATNYAAQMAASVLFSLPVVIFFLLIQRKLVSGMSAGAVKG